jgi:acetylornithine deacetylase/succinyl-diaminopimelate desuccinylase-like protein
MKSRLESISENHALEGDSMRQEAHASPALRKNINARAPAAVVTQNNADRTPGTLDQLKWEEIFSEAEGILRTLIQFQTVNPPGNERPAAHYLAELLRHEGLEPEIYEGAPTRTNLVCRLRGTGERPPLQLDGHLDVVPADESQWTHPPFAADVADGYIWGRGALDMKQTVTMSLMCLFLFKRLGFRFKRDIIFTAVADEEVGGTYGAKYLIDNHADAIRAEYCLGEIGGFSLSAFGKNFYPVQVAEKGVCWFELVARGKAGHGSVLDPESSVIRLSEAILKLSRQTLPRHKTAVAEHLVATVLATQPFPSRILAPLLLRPWLSSLLLDKVLSRKQFAAMLFAMLHNTANPTKVRAGEKTNVIPSVAKAEIDGRFLPGQTKESFLAEVKDVVGPDLEINVLSELKPTIVEHEDPIMIQRHDPPAIALPVMISATTNATHYSRLGTKYFGFSPVKFNSEDDFQSMFHGNNERIPVEGFHFGIRALAELVKEICT